MFWEIFELYNYVTICLKIKILFHKLHYPTITIETNIPTALADP